MADILRIIDTVPLANREEYVQTCKEFINSAPQGMKHIGSWRVAFGHALDFMHLWEFQDMGDLRTKLAGQLTEEQRELGARINSLASDTYWEWLAPLGG